MIDKLYLSNFKLHDDTTVDMSGLNLSDEDVVSRIPKEVIRKIEKVTECNL